MQLSSSSLLLLLLPPPLLLLQPPPPPPPLLLLPAKRAVGQLRFLPMAAFIIKTGVFLPCSAPSFSFLVL
jgi:hypothetical protein